MGKNKKFKRRVFISLILMIIGVLIVVFGNTVKLLGYLMAFVGVAIIFHNLGDKIGKWAGFHEGYYDD